MVDRDTVDYRDTSSFDDSSLQDVQTIKSAILHKQYGKDVRSALAQLPDSLIKLFGDTGGNSNTEVEEARGGFETLGLHEQAQNSSIDEVTAEVQNARTNSSSQIFPTLKERIDNQESKIDNRIDNKLAQISSVPETFANLAALKNAYPNGRTGIFVTADTGHKYIWANNVWNDAGVYQSVGIADRSIDLNKISGQALSPVFIPSADGDPTLSSKTLILDFNAVKDRPLIRVKNDAATQLKIGSQLKLDFSASSLISIGVDIQSGEVTQSPRAVDLLDANQVVIGYIRNNNGLHVSGPLAQCIVIDGYYLHDELSINTGIFLSPSANGVPNFDSKTMLVDFLSTSDSQAVIAKGRVNYMVPAGLIAQPTGSIIQNGGRSFKLWYNTKTSKAWVTSYGENPTDESLLLATFFTSNGVIRSSINMTVDGHFPDEEFFSFTPSHNGNPFYDVKTNTLDFNCYSDQAYVRYNGVNKQIPLKYYIDVPELIAGSTARILYNPIDNVFSTAGYQAPIPVGYIQVASIRLTRTSGAISQGAFEIDYLGNHGNNGYTKQSKYIKQIAHRGFNVSAPEQSKLAYTMASTYGINEWEGDIQFTSDNVPVLWHDNNVKGYAADSNGNIVTTDLNISDTTYADLIKYDFGYSKSPKYKGTPILSVEEMFKLARIYDANMHLEFKNDYDDAKIQNLVNLVNKYGIEKNLSWQSFNSTYFSRVVKLLPKVTLEFLTMLNDDNEVTRLLADMDSFKSDGRNLIASADSYNSSVDRVNRVTDNGYQIYIWTVDDAETVNKFADCLVSGFMTNGNVDVNGTIRKRLMS